MAKTPSVDPSAVGTILFLLKCADDCVLPIPPCYLPCTDGTWRLVSEGPGVTQEDPRCGRLYRRGCCLHCPAPSGARGGWQRGALNLSSLEKLLRCFESCRSSQTHGHARCLRPNAWSFCAVVEACTEEPTLRQSGRVGTMSIYASIGGSFYLVLLGICLCFAL